MTVGMTPRNSGTAQSLRPFPGGQTDLTGPSGAPEVGSRPVGEVLGGDEHPVPADDPEPARPDVEGRPDPRTEGRRQLRAARKRRRRISIGCAVLIAVCTALTLLIVAVARDRSPSLFVVTPPPALVSSAPVVHHAVLVVESTETLGALAPQGGHR
jgi:hypothetical protein